MSPTPELLLREGIALRPRGQGDRPTESNALIIEGWGQGYMVGSLVILICITVANMRRGLLLHKLILLEVRITKLLLSGLLRNATGLHTFFRVKCLGLTSHRLQLILGIWHGFFIFLENPAYSWWLSVSAIFLNTSWSLHNVIAWIKLKPFLTKMGSLVFICTVIVVQPYWVVEIYANFAYFHDQNTIFLKTRPWEALMR